VAVHDSAGLRFTSLSQEHDQCIASRMRGAVQQVLESRGDWRGLDPRRGMGEQVLAAANTTIEVVSFLSIAFLAPGRHMIY